MKNNKKNSPLSQDSKFDTTAHDYGRRAHKMTAKERSDYRTGMGHALAFTPTGRALKTISKAAGIIKSNIGAPKPAFSIGQGLVRGFGSKGMKKTYDKVFKPSTFQQSARPALRQQKSIKPSFDYANRVTPAPVTKVTPNVSTKSGLTPKVRQSGMNKPVTKPKSTDPYALSSEQLKWAKGMSTPLKPNFTPKNPRGYETYTWAGGRQRIKPGTPGWSKGGMKKPYSAKHPLLPTFKGTNLDKILYPRNWK